MPQGSRPVAPNAGAAGGMLCPRHQRTAGAVDGARPLRPSAEKGVAGDRLNADDGVRLYASSDLLGLGRMAAFANTRCNGDRVLFSANQHINPTNVCVLRNTCVFCSFARVPKEEGASTRSLEEASHEGEQARRMRTRGRDIVDGSHPTLRVRYNSDM